MKGCYDVVVAYKVVEQHNGPLTLKQMLLAYAKQRLIECGWATDETVKTEFTYNITYQMSGVVVTCCNVTEDATYKQLIDVLGDDD